MAAWRTLGPRALRDAIREGRITSDGCGDPKTPKAWPVWRRDRLRVALTSARLFLAGKRWHEIRTALNADRLLEDPECGKTRIMQYVARGVTYLQDNGAFRYVRAIQKTK